MNPQGSKLLPQSILLIVLTFSVLMTVCPSRLHGQDPDAGPDLIKASERIVFLGDSITYAGHYITIVEAWLETQDDLGRPTVINVGLPSETVSGLSEEGHAGGRFPRPDLAERLDRVLATCKPDLVFACYGINCGIYQPFDPQRFEKYQSGLGHLKEKVEAAGARLVLITPPSYDDVRASRSFSYDAVLDRYSRWLLEQRDNGWIVIDLHGPMVSELKRRRQSDPDFTFQPDAVHPNSAGHWFVAGELLRWCGADIDKTAESAAEFLDAVGIDQDNYSLVRQRSEVRRDAYLSAAGHQRPGIREGLPVDQAEERAAELTDKIRSAWKDR